jgi:phosphotransferase system  glucose/maltose/N-acetylglucosamine-specific IIC component
MMVLLNILNLKRMLTMSILGYLQKIGRALMVPVATLPAAAILMGIGYWIDPQGWGGGSPTAGFLIKAGAAIIDTMALLFAVGVAYGMSKDKYGSAALSGLVGWLVLTTLLAPDTIAMLKGVKVEEIAPAFGKIKNQFVGILIGVITAELYNYYSKVNLHSALAFFSGRRLVPIVVSVAMIFVAPTARQTAIANKPIGPQPSTATDLPASGSTSAAWTAFPRGSWRQLMVFGMRGSFFSTLAAGTAKYWPKQPSVSTPKICVLVQTWPSPVLHCRQ